MTNEEKILQLARQFPYFFDRIPQRIVDPEFDAPALDKWASFNAGVLSEYEVILTQFILMVWDWRHEWQSGPFNIAQAVNVLDGENWAVIKAWCQEPFLL